MLTRASGSGVERQAIGGAVNQGGDGCPAFSDRPVGASVWISPRGMESGCSRFAGPGTANAIRTDTARPEGLRAIAADLRRSPGACACGDYRALQPLGRGDRKALRDCGVWYKTIWTAPLSEPRDKRKAHQLGQPRVDVYPLA